MVWESQMEISWYSDIWVVSWYHLMIHVIGYDDTSCFHRLYNENLNVLKGCKKVLQSLNQYEAV